MWKRISTARELIEEGSKWRVKNGAQIKVWRNKWLTTQSSYQVQTSINLLHENIRVKELFTEDGSK